MTINAFIPDRIIISPSGSFEQVMNKPDTEKEGLLLHNLQGLERGISLKDEKFKEKLQTVAGPRLSFLSETFKRNKLDRKQAANRKLIQGFFKERVMISENARKDIKALKKEIVKLNKEIKKLTAAKNKNKLATTNYPDMAKLVAAQSNRDEKLSKLVQYKEALNKSLVNRDLLLQDSKGTYLEGTREIRKLSRNIDKINKEMQGLMKIKGWGGYELRKIKEFIKGYGVDNTFVGRMYDIRDLEKRAHVLNKILSEEEGKVPLDEATRKDAIGAFRAIIALGTTDLNKDVARLKFENRADQNKLPIFQALQRMEAEAKASWGHEPMVK